MPRANPLVAFCRKLPHATEDLKWVKDLCFSIGGKMFAVFNVENLDQVSFKTSPENFTLLTQQPGFVPAPYAARFHWIAVRDPKALPQSALRELLRESYDLVAAKLPRKLRRELGMD